MQLVLDQGSIGKPLNFDVALYKSVFMPVCSPNKCKGVFSPNSTTFQLSQIAPRVCALLLFISYINCSSNSKKILMQEMNR